MTMDNILISPPVAFLIILFVVIVFAHALTRLSFKQKDRPADIDKPYACGEDITNHRLQPDYTDFFPFVFFFTIMHVIALFIATVPKGSFMTLGISIIYLLGAVVGLYILYRK